MWTNSDLEEIQREIHEFRSRAKRILSPGEALDKISGIFGSVLSFSVMTHFYPKGTVFFRARAVPEADREIPLQMMAKVQDAWDPPPEFVTRQGRLNAIGQSLLYCCPHDPWLAVCEAQALQSQNVAVIVYSSIVDVKVAKIGDNRSEHQKGDPKADLFYKFLDEEFSKIASDGEESVYSISAAIADTFFNYPEQDAWCYRSVRSHDKLNVAFLTGRSQHCLRLRGAMICDVRESKEGSLAVKFVVDFDPSSGAARYHPVGSDHQKILFPEIS